MVHGTIKTSSTKRNSQAQGEQAACSDSVGFGGIVRPPFDDPAETHGYCPRHAALLLASLPSLSFPDVELLIVVRRHDVPLFEYLQRRLDGVRGVKVILERRIADRRHELRQRAPDRRRLRRRLGLGQASSLGYTVVRFRPR